MNQVGMRYEKDWGYTTLVFQSQTVEVHALEINEGGYCSEHRHKKINIFYVQTGLLRVKTWDGKKLINKTVLGPGQMTCVYGGLFHEFEALEETRCLEVYHTFLEPGDIERRTEGGAKR